MLKCDKCDGTGQYYYSNTATWDTTCWIAGQGFTWDICDKCWGSGDLNNPGTNLIAEAQKI